MPLQGRADFLSVSKPCTHNVLVKNFLFRSSLSPLSHQSFSLSLLLTFPLFPSEVQSHSSRTLLYLCIARVSDCLRIKSGRNDTQETKIGWDEEMRNRTWDRRREDDEREEEMEDVKAWKKDGENGSVLQLTSVHQGKRKKERERKKERREEVFLEQKSSRS